MEAPPKITPLTERFHMRYHAPKSNESAIREPNMANIVHIPASQVTDLTTLYIGGLHGTVISVENNGYDDDLWITLEDANGERTIRCEPVEELPTLV